MAKKKSSGLKYEEICLYCKSYDMKSQECKRKHVDPKKDPERLGAKVKPHTKPEDQKCKSYKRTDDSAFAFGEGGISFYEETDWSAFKRDALLKQYAKALYG